MTKTKCPNIRGGETFKVGGMLILVLVENRDGHRGCDYNLQEAGRANFHGGQVRGVFNTYTKATGRDTDYRFLSWRHPGLGQRWQRQKLRFFYNVGGSEARSGRLVLI